MSLAPATRPAPPGRSWWVPVVLAAFLAVTAWAAISIDLDPADRLLLFCNPDFVFANGSGDAVRGRPQRPHAGLVVGHRRRRQLENGAAPDARQGFLVRLFSPPNQHGAVIPASHRVPRRT